MKYLLPLLTLSLLFSQELEVEGDLKVTGTVESATIDSMQVIIDSLALKLTALEDSGNYRLINYQLEDVWASTENEETIVYELIIPPNTVKEFLDVKVDILSGNTSGAHVYCYFGELDNEIEYGAIRGHTNMSNNSDYNTYNPQGWVVIPLNEEIVTLTTRLYLTATYQLGWYHGGVDKVFVFGK